MCLPRVSPVSQSCSKVSAASLSPPNGVAHHRLSLTLKLQLLLGSGKAVLDLGESVCWPSSVSLLLSQNIEGKDCAGEAAASPELERKPQSRG